MKKPRTTEPTTIPPTTPNASRSRGSFAALDDCDESADVSRRADEHQGEDGKHGAGLVGHFSPDSARRLRAALATALREMGEEPGA